MNSLSGAVVVASEALRSAKLSERLRPAIRHAEQHLSEIPEALWGEECVPRAEFPIDVLEDVAVTKVVSLANDLNIHSVGLLRCQLRKEVHLAGEGQRLHGHPQLLPV